MIRQENSFLCAVVFSVLTMARWMSPETSLGADIALFALSPRFWLHVVLLIPMYTYAFDFCFRDTHELYRWSA